MCDGGGCPACDDRGYGLMRSCPTAAVPRGVWSMFAAADDAAKGLLPVGGGTLDQTAQFVECRRLCESIDGAYRRKLEAGD